MLNTFTYSVCVINGTKLIHGTNIISFADAASYLSVARQPTVLHLRKPISWHLHPSSPPPPTQTMNVSAATSSNTMSTSYHLRVEGISAVQRFPPGSCLNFRGELAHICSLRIRETAPQEKSFACNKHGLCRCYFRGCFHAFVCFLMDQADFLVMEL